MLKTELHTNEIPEIFSRFKSTVDEKYWIKRTKQIKADSSGRPHLKKYLEEDNSMAFQLAICSRLNAYEWSSIIENNRLNSLYPALTFATQSLSIVDLCPPPQKPQMIRRIQGSFNNPDDLRAMELEFRAATHFSRRGHTISWPEMDKTGTFDLFVHDAGLSGLEIECKLISENKGRKIHRREAIEFQHIAKIELERITKNLKRSLAIVLTIPDRLPKEHKKRQNLAKSLSSQIIVAKNGFLEDGSEVRITEFDPKEVDSNQTPSRETIDRITSTQNKEIMILGKPGREYLILVLQSRSDNSTLDYIFETLENAAKKQLSKHRAGLILAGFHSLTSDELISIAKHDGSKSQPSALRIYSDKFLKSKNRDHVVNLCFFSKDQLNAEQSIAAQSSGSVYSFSNKDSKMWHDDFSDLFTEI